MEFDFITSFNKAFILSIKMSAIIILVMLFYQLFQESKFYLILQDIINFPLKYIGFTKKSSVTMVVGLILGIAYGAGILIQDSLSGKMTYKEILLSSLFLSLCHAVFEDTLIFVAVGANGFLIIVTRIILAILIIGLLSKFLKNKIL